MQELKVFDYNSMQVRMVEKNGEPWFVLKDVCEVLDLRNATMIANRLENDEVTKLNLGGRVGITNVINEPGLYKVILRSDKPEAKPFSKWVTRDVLPSIRKHGMYATDELLDNPDLLISVATALKEEREQRKALETQNLVLEQKVAEYEPIVQYVDMILKCKDVVATSQIAADYGISARRLNKILHEERIQYNVGGQWILYSNHMNKGYTKSETISFKRSDGRDDVRMQTKWTQKGRLMIHNLLESRGIKANVDKENLS